MSAVLGICTLVGVLSAAFCFSPGVTVSPHAAAIMLWYASYNFCRIHESLRVTPAMEAGISDHVWNLAELLA